MDAIKRKQVIQKMHDLLQQSVDGIQQGLDEFPPSMYIDERMAGLGTSLIQEHIMTIVDAMYTMQIPAKTLAESFANMGKERETIFMILVLASRDKNGDNDDKIKGNEK